MLKQFRANTSERVLTDMSFKDTHSLWALSVDGILWQVNPISGKAAPVYPLNELSTEDCNTIKREMQAIWRGEPAADIASHGSYGAVEESMPPRYDVACC